MVEPMWSVEKSTNVRTVVIVLTVSTILSLVWSDTARAAAQAPDLSLMAADAAIREGAALINQGRWRKLARPSSGRLPGILTSPSRTTTSA